MLQDEMYKLFLRNRDRLVEIAKRYNRVILELLVMKEEQEIISQLVTRLDNEQFKLLIIGEFSRGKSTFINALLKTKEEILPTDVLETTAVITEVKYGDKPQAIVHYKPEFMQDGDGTKAVPYIAILNQMQFYSTIIFSN